MDWICVYLSVIAWLSEIESVCMCFVGVCICVCVYLSKEGKSKGGGRYLLSCLFHSPLWYWHAKHILNFNTLFYKNHINIFEPLDS